MGEGSEEKSKLGNGVRNMVGDKLGSGDGYFVGSSDGGRVGKLLTEGLELRYKEGQLVGEVG